MNRTSHHSLAKARTFTRWAGMILGLIALALGAIAWADAHGMHPDASIFAAAAVLPLVGGAVIDPNKSGDGETEFRQKVLDGVTHQKSLTDQLVTDFSRLTGETKKAFDDLTLLKRTANDTDAALKATTKAIERIDALLRREARMAFGDPIRRIAADEEKRIALNLAVRLAVDRSGDMRRLVRSAFPSDMVKRALGEDSSPGSTLIDDKLSADIYDTLATYGIWNTFNVQRLGTKQTKFPVKTVRPIANYILTEGGTIADDANKAGTSVTLEVEVIAALLKVSLQLLEDAEYDITADVLDDFAQALALRLDYSCTQADGTANATSGGMTGIFGGGATAAAAAATHSTTEATTLADWTNAILAVDPQVLMRPAKWWIHPQHIVRAINVKDSNGRPIFLTANEAPTVGGIGSILGYPVVPTMAAPTTNAAATKMAVFGDPAGLVVGMRRDFAFESSDEFSWNTFERAFRGVARAGIKIRRSAAFAALTLTA